MPVEGKLFTDFKLEFSAQTSGGNVGAATRRPCRRMLRFRTKFRQIRNIVPQRALTERPYIHDGKCCVFAENQCEFVAACRDNPSVSLFG